MIFFLGGESLFLLPAEGMQIIGGTNDKTRKTNGGVAQAVRAQDS